MQISNGVGRTVKTALVIGALVGLGATALAVGWGRIPLEGDMRTLQVLSPRQKLPQKLPLTDASGAPYDLSQHVGKVVVVNYWATWCTPCITEMPALNALAQTRPDTVAVAAVSVDRGGPEQVRSFYEKHGLEELPAIVDPSMQSMQMLGLNGLPTTLLLDREGRIAARYQGPAEWDGAAAARVIDALITETDPAVKM